MVHGNFYHCQRKDIGGVHDVTAGGGAAAANDGGGSQIQINGSSGFGSSQGSPENAFDDQYQFIKPSNIEALVKSKFYAEIKDIPPLNLKLENWQSLAMDIETRLSEQQWRTQMNQSKRPYLVPQLVPEKVKASNMPATVLRIGSWERVPRNEGDLVAKCYYGKKKLVWEMLEISLKKKVEIQWADIVGIRATFKEQECEILELELMQPPSFHHEIDPQPRKHTNWRVTEDFTGGQALICRRHHLKFAPGVLEKHYAKLLQNDDRLNELSKKPFPTLDSPYFLPATTTYGFPDFPLRSSAQRPQIYHGLNFPHSHMNPSMFSTQQVQSCQPTMQMQMQHPSFTFSASCQPTMQMQMQQPSFSFNETSQPTMQMQQPSFRFSDLSSPDSAEPFDNPGMRFWGQATNNIPTNQVPGQFTIASTTAEAEVPYQNNNYGEAQTSDEEPLFDQMLLDGGKNSLMTHSQFWPDIVAGSSDTEISGNELSNDTAEHVNAQPYPWMQPQGSDNPLHPAQITQEMPENPWYVAQATQEMPMSQHGNRSGHPLRDDLDPFNDKWDNNNRYT